MAIVVAMRFRPLIWAVSILLVVALLACAISTDSVIQHLCFDVFVTACVTLVLLLVVPLIYPRRRIATATKVDVFTGGSHAPPYISPGEIYSPSVEEYFSEERLKK